MDLENQQRVKDAAEKYGAENVVVILGSSDPEGAEIYAETVTLGDPTFAGPLESRWASAYVMCLNPKSRPKPMPPSGMSRSV